jgi:hypothetical protein
MTNIFSHSVGGLFSLETISFVVQKLFNFVKSGLSIISLSCWAAGVLLRKSLPIPISSSVSWSFLYQLQSFVSDIQVFDPF